MDNNFTQLVGTRIETWRYGSDGSMQYNFVTLTDGVVTSISGPKN